MSSFASADILIKFLYSLQLHCKNILQDAVSSELNNSGETKFGEHSRKGVVCHLMKYLNEDDGPRFSKFQVQVFMRTIETCIHDPFGDVNVVPIGHGGLSGTRCFVGEYDKSKYVSD